MDPYVYTDTNVLINKLDIRDPQQLTVIEGRFFTLRSLEPLPTGNFDYNHLKAIHVHFLNDLYSWAGQERTVDIAKDNSYFAHVPYISKELNKVFKQLETQDNFLRNLGHNVFCDKLSYYFNEINAAHPFREGNGRTQRAFCGLLAKEAGHYINWELLQHRAAEYIQASAEGFLHGNYRPMTELLLEITSGISPQRVLKNTVIEGQLLETFNLYVNKQLELTEAVRQKILHSGEDAALVIQFSQQATLLDTSLKAIAGTFIENAEIQTLLKQPSLVSLNAQGGFAAVQARLQKNEINPNDVLAVLRHMQTQARASLDKQLELSRTEQGKKTVLRLK